MSVRTERVLKHGEFKIPRILCELEDALAIRWGRKAAEEFVNGVEAVILGETKALELRIPESSIPQETT